MKLVAGLGNPGPRYAHTRHNAGYAVVDELARRWGVDVEKYEPRYEALIAEAQVAGQRVLLLKPQPLMNLSGRSLLAAGKFYQLACTDLLIVCDDLDLEAGRLRLRAGGSGGGHKGLENVLLRLASNDVPRLRIGIGKVDKSVTSAYVLSRFAPDERERIEQAVRTAADAVECWLDGGIDAAMNRFNPRRGDGARGEQQPSSDDAPEGESP
ncbi:MAG: aminoacyl-tRNA hydrolase [Phycisphaerae bacterium]